MNAPVFSRFAKNITVSSAVPASLGLAGCSASQPTALVGAPQAPSAAAPVAPPAPAAPPAAGAQHDYVFRIGTGRARVLDYTVGAVGDQHPSAPIRF
ncbi:hypothetical protein ACIRBX_07630 [Kitasatospora sp. NPDC096147]|uniref:hypothetical protein n=1 Tax=Kitasatospora sp. NPDC096147 TaxID=3364093 RepID=UPI0038114BDF